MKKKGERGPDYVQEHTGHTRRGFSHGMTPNSNRSITRTHNPCRKKPGSNYEDPHFRTKNSRLFQAQHLRNQSFPCDFFYFVLSILICLITHSHSLFTQENIAIAFRTMFPATNHSDHDYIIARQEKYIEAWRSGSPERIMEFMHSEDLNYSNFSPYPPPVFPFPPTNLPQR